jgi:hypothetical protein
VNELHKSSITVKNFQENWNKNRTKAKNEIVAPGGYESRPKLGNDNCPSNDWLQSRDTLRGVSRTRKSNNSNKKIKNISLFL